MTQEEFWQLIDKTRAESGNNPTKQAELLVKALTTMPVEDILDYNRVEGEYWLRAYRTDLWDAVSIIFKYCSDDSFFYFRAWLIGQGLSIYEKTLQEPDTLVDLVSIEERYDIMAEELIHVSHSAYDIKTNTDKGIRYTGTAPVLQRNSPCFSTKEDSNWKKCLKERYPKLWAKFGV